MRPNPSLFKNQFAKELLDLKAESEVIIQRFNEVNLWRNEIINGYSANL